MPAGRPTDYSDKILEKTRQFFEDYEPHYDSPCTLTFKDGTTKEFMETKPKPPPYKRDLALHLGVNLSTIWRWEKEHEEFCNLIKEYGREVRETCLVQNGTMGLYNASFSIFAAKNMLNWQDKTLNETNSTVKHEFPSEIKFIIVKADGNTDTGKAAIPDSGTAAI